MPTGFTTVSGTKVVDATGTPVTGHISFTPVLNNAQPTAFQPGGGGTAGAAPVTAVLTAGAFSIQLADTQLSNPLNLAYHVHAFDANGRELLGNSYAAIQPTGSTWSLDNCPPNATAQLPAVQGKQGIQGPSGLLTGDYVGPFVPTSITVGDTTIAPSMLTDGTVVFGIGDENGCFAILLYQDGSIKVANLGGKAAFDTLNIGAIAATPLDNNSLSALFAIADPNGYCALVVNPDGSTSVAKLVTANAALTFGNTVQGSLPYTNEGYMGLVIADAAGNVAFGIRTDGKIVGTLANPYVTPIPPIPPLGKATDLKKGTLLHPLFGLNVELVLGESTGSGIQGAPIVSTAQPWANITFSSGVRNGSLTSYTLAIPALTGLTAFIPLVQTEEFGTGAIAGTIFGETILNGVSDRMTSDLATLGLKAKILASSSCLPGVVLANLLPSTDSDSGGPYNGTMYNQFAQIIAAAVSTAGSTYGTVGVHTVSMVFGPLSGRCASYHSGCYGSE
jgi:hypothetical protein